VLYPLILSNRLKFDLFDCHSGLTTFFDFSAAFLDLSSAFFDLSSAFLLAISSLSFFFSSHSFFCLSFSFFFFSSFARNISYPSELVSTLAPVTLVLVTASFSDIGTTYCTKNFDRGDVRLALEVLLVDVGVDAVLTIDVSLLEVLEVWLPSSS